MSRRAIVTAAVLVLAVLTGCTPQPPQLAPSATPSPRFTSEADAYKAAEATYRAYTQALNKVDLSDPATFEEAYRWSTGTALDADKKNLTRYHAEGVVKSGETLVTVVEPRSVEGDFSVVMLNVCDDVSSVDLRAPDGKSLVKSTRSPVQALAVELEKSETLRPAFS